jgi:TonB family protein
MLPPRAFTHVLALAFLAPFVALAADEGCTRVDGKACARACGDGDAIACWLLGTMHRDGTGVRRDARRAAALYEQACAAGAEVACLYAAAAYASGRGVKKDESRATALLGSCAAKDSNGCDPRCPSPAPSATPASSPPSSSDDDKPPRPVKIVKPSYPQYAFDKKIEGTVEVQISIGASGKVTDACIAQSVPYLDHAALEAVYQWRFSPAIKNGSPVATIARAPVMFRIY